MTPYRQTATIYQFPVKTRATAGRQRSETGAVSEPKVTRLTDAAVGGGWYHEAALRDCEPTRKP